VKITLDEGDADERDEECKSYLHKILHSHGVERQLKYQEWIRSCKTEQNSASSIVV
jgi:hypothetical protein